MQFIHPPWARSGGRLNGVVKGVSTTRSGGASQPPYDSLNLALHVGDDAADVEINRQRLQQWLGFDKPVRWLDQVHGKSVIDAADWRAGVEADAIVCREPGIPVGVLTADCLPVLLASEDGKTVAAAHAGWRGLAEGILPATVAAMKRPASTILAWIGPGISQPAYEVGDELRDIFVNADHRATNCFVPNERGRWQADLKMLALLSLRSAGVSRVTDCGRCTYTDADDFFSYRRAAPCGRMASLIWIA